MSNTDQDAGFNLTLAMGDADMQDAADVARELRAVADQIEGQEDSEGTIYGPNGNQVGSFTFRVPCVDCGRAMDPVILRENATDRCEDCDADHRDAEQRRRHLFELQAIGYTRNTLDYLADVERRAHKAAEDYCNVPDFDWDAAETQVREDAAELFGGELPAGFFVNGDPRGYALKLREGTGSLSYRDWGGFEILAPDFSE